MVVVGATGDFVVVGECGAVVDVVGFAVVVVVAGAVPTSTVFCSIG